MYCQWLSRSFLQAIQAAEPHDGRPTRPVQQAMPRLEPQHDGRTASWMTLTAASRHRSLLLEVLKPMRLATGSTMLNRPSSVRFRTISVLQYLCYHDTLIEFVCRSLVTTGYPNITHVGTCACLEDINGNILSREHGDVMGQVHANATHDVSLLL